MMRYQWVLVVLFFFSAAWTGCTRAKSGDDNEGSSDSVSDSDGDSTGSDGDGDTDTDTDTEVHTDTDSTSETASENPGCFDPCLDDEGVPIADCLSVCGGFAGTGCPSEALTCYIVSGDFGVCIPKGRISCQPHDNELCQCLSEYLSIPGTEDFIWVCGDQGNCIRDQQA
jgi:hypothetical protein